MYQHQLLGRQPVAPELAAYLHKTLS